MTQDLYTFVEIGLGEEYEGFWLPAGPGIYSTRIFVEQNEIQYGFGFGSFGYGDYTTDGTTSVLIGTRKKYVATVFIEDEFYIKTLSLEDMFAVEKSFYYDSINQVLYLRLENNAHPDTITTGQLLLGFTTRFSDKEMIMSINGQPEYLQSRIQRWGKLKKSRDPLFFKTITYDTSKIELINTDGELDDFHTKDYYGQTVYIKQGVNGADYSTFQTIYSSNVGNINYKNNIMQLDLEDQKKQLTRKLPANKLTASEYPDIGGNEGVGKPLVYGSVRRAPTVCLNEDADPTYYEFMVADTSVHNIGGITKAYTNRREVAIHDINLVNGTFRVAASAIESADGSSDEVFADVNGFVDDEGIPITNGLHILRDIIENFTPAIYSKSFFDTTQWDAAELLSADLAISIWDEIEINEIIENISLSLYGYFIITDDGLFTFRYSDVNQTPMKTILPKEFLERPKFDYKQNEYASSVIVKYDKDYEADRYRRSVYKENESDVVLRYKQYKEEVFETYLKNKSDADALSSKIANQHNEIKPLITVEVGSQHYDLKIGDVVKVGLYYEPTRWKFDNQYISIVYPVKCEVLGVDKSIEDNIVTLKLWYINSDGHDLSNAKTIKGSMFSSPVFVGSKPSILEYEYDETTDYSYGDIITYNGEMYYYTG